MRYLIVAIIGLFLIGGAVYIFRPLKDNSAIRSEQQSAVVQKDLADFKDPEGSFEFHYPADMDLKQYNEKGQTLIFSLPNDSTVGFQLVTSEYNGTPAEFTLAELERSLSPLVIADATAIRIGEGRGYSFSTNDPAFDGESREIWFVDGKSLYQMSTYPKNKDILDQVFSSWTFLK